VVEGFLFSGFFIHLFYKPLKTKPMNYSHEYLKTKKSVMSKHLYSLPAVLMLVVILFLSGCKGDCTECCDTTDEVIAVSTSYSIGPIQQFNGTIQPGQIYYYYLGGTPQRVQFFTGRTTDDICTDEHLKITYNVETNAESLTRPIKIFGEVYWSVFSDDVIIWDGPTQLVHTYIGELSDVGLKQAFPEGAATVDVYINVEYESLGSFELDTAFLRAHIIEFYARYEYKKF
jgi:hypothetical protein